jgi:hypothetical protein
MNLPTISKLNPHKKYALCGTESDWKSSKPGIFRNLGFLTRKSLRKYVSISFVSFIQQMIGNET